MTIQAHGKDPGGGPHGPGRLGIVWGAEHGIKCPRRCKSESGAVDPLFGGCWTLQA